MAFDYINTAVNGQFAEIDIVIDQGEADFAAAHAAPVVAGDNTRTVAALQDITLNSSPGVFRFKTLESLSEYAITTASTNSISCTMVLDSVTFFDAKGDTPSLYDIIKNKQSVFFRLYFNGRSATDRYVDGKAYLSGLAATVSPDSPVWTSPLTLEVVGDFSNVGTVA